MYNDWIWLEMSLYMLFDPSVWVVSLAYRTVNHSSLLHSSLCRKEYFWRNRGRGIDLNFFCLFGYLGYLVGLYSLRSWLANRLSVSDGYLLRREMVGDSVSVEDMMHVHDSMSVFCSGIGVRVRFRWSSPCWVYVSDFVRSKRFVHLHTI